MDKIKVYDSLLARLEEDLGVAIGASRDAADYATNEEARAESKYDTQGLEASYLAAGQASLATENAQAISDLKTLRDEMIQPREKVMRGALVECDLDGESEWFFLCSVGGGEILEVNEQEISVLTVQSPLGATLAGKQAGATFRLPNGLQGKIVSVQ
ncbi:MAG: transcription elongation factor GreAB [Verrucomicrobiota bacterium]